MIKEIAVTTLEIDPQTVVRDVPSSPKSLHKVAEPGRDEDDNVSESPGSTSRRSPGKKSRSRSLLESNLLKSKTAIALGLKPGRSRPKGPKPRVAGPAPLNSTGSSPQATSSDSAAAKASQTATSLPARRDSGFVSRQARKATASDSVSAAAAAVTSSERLAHQPSSFRTPETATIALPESSGDGPVDRRRTAPANEDSSAKTSRSTGRIKGRRPHTTREELESLLYNIRMDVSGPSSTTSLPLDGTALTFEEPPPVPPQPYGEWFRERILNSRWATWFSTFYLHWVLLILLTVLIVHGPDGRGDTMITASFTTPDDYLLEPVEILDTRIEPDEKDEGDEMPALSMMVATNVSKFVDSPLSVPVPQLGVLDNETDEITANASTEAAASDAKTIPRRPVYIDPIPGDAVTEGSFSVWTVPANPDPGEPYRIIIRIRLPEGIEQYPASDLLGLVVGSDGYRKQFPAKDRGDVPIRNGYVQFVVPIVSADEYVRDTVYVKSKLLKEAHELVIEF